MRKIIKCADCRKKMYLYKEATGYPINVCKDCLIKRGFKFERSNVEMNKQTQARINQALLHVRPSNLSGSHDKCFRCNPHDSDLHIHKMFERWLEYRKLGIEVRTEVIFLNGQRADILLPSLSPPLIEEIMVTETEKRLEAKDYPFPVKAIKVK